VELKYLFSPFVNVSVQFWLVCTSIVALAVAGAAAAIVTLPP
jgi:hypothetical protein